MAAEKNNKTLLGTPTSSEARSLSITHFRNCHSEQSEETFPHSLSQLAFGEARILSLTHYRNCHSEQSEETFPHPLSQLSLRAKREVFPLPTFETVIPSEARKLKLS